MPVAISGVMGLGRGLAALPRTKGVGKAITMMGREIGRGAQKPFMLPYRSLKGAKALKTLQGGGPIARSEVMNLAKMMQESPATADIAEKVLANPAKGSQILQNYFKYMPKERADRIVHSLQGEASSALTSLGLSGAIGAGAAGLQYGKGRKAGGIMTPEQRAQITGVQP